VQAADDATAPRVPFPGAALCTAERAPEAGKPRRRRLEHAEDGAAHVGLQLVRSEPSCRAEPNRGGRLERRRGLLFEQRIDETVCVSRRDLAAVQG
jgi:hypothetical protein